MDSKLLPILWIITCATQVWAAHTRLETAGRTYPIIEQDITKELQQKATAIDLDALFNTHNRYQPANLHTLPRASSDRMFTVDLTHTLDHDVKDNQGNLLYPQGFTFNPLQYARLSGGLVAIDGSDPEQIEYDDFVLQLLKSVKSNPPKYSEIFFDTPFGLGVARLVVNDYDYFIYTSKPVEIAAIEAMVKNGLTYHEAILEMVARREQDEL